jgi:hypothetical protein
VSEIQLALQGNVRNERTLKKKKGKAASAPDEQSYMRVSFDNSEDCMSSIFLSSFNPFIVLP